MFSCLPAGKRAHRVKPPRTWGCPEAQTRLRSQSWGWSDLPTPPGVQESPGTVRNLSFILPWPLPLTTELASAAGPPEQGCKVSRHHPAPLEPASTPGSRWFSFNKDSKCPSGPLRQCCPGLLGSSECSHDPPTPGDSWTQEERCSSLGQTWAGRSLQCRDQRGKRAHTQPPWEGHNPVSRQTQHSLSGPLSPSPLWQLQGLLNPAGKPFQTPLPWAPDTRGRRAGSPRFL